MESGESPLRIRDTRHGGLTRLFAELGYTVGAEIGVEQGRYSEEICRANPAVRLYCIDPWQAYDRYADHVSQRKLDGFYDEAMQRLRVFNTVVIRKTSMEAVKEFRLSLLDFVYIDGNHEFEFVVNDIIQWAKIVRPGGIVAGHDYKREGAERTPIPFHVIEAVQAYTSAYHIKPWFIWTKDKCPSWMWVKP